MVNAIPGRATLESYVRSSSFEGMVEANKKVNRAFTGAALSLGAGISINDFPGYAPLVNDKELINVAIEAAALAIPDKKFTYLEGIGSGSTDMGDLSAVMPVVHPYAGGRVGTGHGADNFVANPVDACTGSAKLQMGMLYLLLGDGAKRAKKVVENYKPLFESKQAYLDFMDSLVDSGERIEYTEDGNAKVRL